MVDKYSCVSGDRAEQISADFYLHQYKKLHADPFAATSSKTGSGGAVPKMHKSTISAASPNFFRTHPNVQLRPQDYSRKLPLEDAFHKETSEFLHPDGSRRHLKLQIGGMEDTAISKDAPTWFQVNKHVTEAPLREKATTFSPFWKPPAQAVSASAVSEVGPDWMKAVSYTHLTLPTIYSV